MKAMAEHDVTKGKDAEDEGLGAPKLGGHLGRLDLC